MPNLYVRNSRYYADLRDLGLGQHALKPSGAGRATTDPVEAAVLMGRLVESLQEERASLGKEPGSLGAVCRDFIDRNPGGVTPKWIGEHGHRLTRARKWFGEQRPLDTIRPKDVREWWEHLEGMDLSPQTVRHHLNSLSSIFRYAAEEELVGPGYNPVAMLYRKPSVSKGRTRSKRAPFLEIDEAARVLEAARTLQRQKRRWLLGGVYELIATFLLTGGRKAEVLGLVVSDVDLENGIIRFRPHEHRPLKVAWAERVLPLWPQLREVLEPWAAGRNGEELLFPGPRGMIHDLRCVLKDVGDAAETTLPGCTLFRHTYATARLQTTDNGKPVSLWTVAKELGHKNVSRVEDTYGHPSQYRLRGETIEFKMKREIQIT